MDDETDFVMPHVAILLMGELPAMRMRCSKEGRGFYRKI
jgi:hypothetical protein